MKKILLNFKNFKNNSQINAYLVETEQDVQNAFDSDINLFPDLKQHWSDLVKKELMIYYTDSSAWGVIHNDEHKIIKIYESDNEIWKWDYAQSQLDEKEVTEKVLKEFPLELRMLPEVKKAENEIIYANTSNHYKRLRMGLSAFIKGLIGDFSINPPIILSIFDEKCKLLAVINTTNDGDFKISYINKNYINKEYFIIKDILNTKEFLTKVFNYIGNFKMSYKVFKDNR